MAGKPPKNPSNDKQALPSLKDYIGTQSDSEKQTAYLADIDASFTKEISQIEKLEKSVTDTVKDELEVIRSFLDKNFRWSKLFNMKYLFIWLRGKRTAKKEALKRAKREDDLSVRQIDSIGIVGRQLSFDLQVIQKLLSRQGSKEQQKEQMSFLRDLYGDLTNGITDALSDLKKSFAIKDKKSWFWTSIKGLILIAAAYIYRSWKLIEPAVVFLKRTIFDRVTDLFKKGGIISRIGSWMKRIGGFFGRIAALFGSKGVIGKFVLSAVDKVIGFFRSIANLFKEGGPLAKVGTFFSNIFTMIKNAFSGGFLSIVSKLKNFFRYVPILGWIITAVEGIVGGFRGWFRSAGKPLMTRIGETILGIFSQIISGLTFGLLSFDDVMGFFDKVTTALGDFFYGVYDFFANTIPNAFSSGIDSITSFFTETIPNFFTETIPSIFQKMMNYFQIASNHIKISLYDLAETLSLGKLDYTDEIGKLEQENYRLSGEKARDEERTRQMKEAFGSYAEMLNQMEGMGLNPMANINLDLMRTQMRTQVSPVGSRTVEQDAAMRRERESAAAGPPTTNNANVSTQINNIMPQGGSLSDIETMLDATDRPNSVYTYTPSPY